MEKVKEVLTLLHMPNVSFYIYILSFFFREETFTPCQGSIGNSSMGSKQTYMAVLVALTQEDPPAAKLCTTALHKGGSAGMKDTHAYALSNPPTYPSIVCSRVFIHLKK